MTRPLRILMTIHTPWSPDLGAPRAAMGVAAGLRRLGHAVEIFSYDHAFPGARDRAPRGGRLERVLAGYVEANRSFAARACQLVRERGAELDVVDAHQTDVPVPKEELGFEGLLVARSVGLIPLYDEFECWSRERWPARSSPGAAAHRIATWRARRRRSRDALASLRHADLINVSNQDELEYVASELGGGGRSVYLPLGLTGAEREALAAAALPPGERLATSRVVFIGTWNARKGAADWPRIVQRVHQRNPKARFRFLGTGHSQEQVEKDFPASLRPAIEVVPRYSNEQLPGLLADAAVGAFPSYIEGFGIAWLEMIAAGLPTLVYDAPGAREMLRLQASPTCATRGDAQGFANGLCALLALPAERHGELGREGQGIAAAFDWDAIAGRTAEIYRESVDRLGRRSDG